MVAILLSTAWLLADDTVTLRPSRADAPAPALDGGRVIAQTFIPPTDGLEAISLRLATYRQEVDGDVRVELRGPMDIAEGGDGRSAGTTGGRNDDQGGGRNDGRSDDLSADPANPAALIAEWSVPGPSIEDTQWRRFPLPAPIDGIAGSELEVVLVRSKAGGNPPTVMLSEGDLYPAGRLRVDGEPLDGDLDLLLEFRPGRIGRAAYLLSRTGYPAPLALSLVIGLVASALGFLYRFAPRPDRSALREADFVGDLVGDLQAGGADAEEIV